MSIKRDDVQMVCMCARDRGIDDYYIDWLGQAQTKKILVLRK